MRCARCGGPAHWRLGVPGDPWPLQYACDPDVAVVAIGLGGDVRATRIDAGQPTPAPREPEDPPVPYWVVGR